MKTIFLNSLLALSFTLLLPLQALAVSAPVFVDTNSQNIPPYLNGLNQNWFKFPRIESRAVQEVINRSNFNPIRFPGGTVANVYSWENLAPNWVAAEDFEGLPNLKSGFEKQVLSLSVIDFMKTVKTTTGKDVSLTVNTISETPDNVLATLQKIKQAGLYVKWIEVGNENHFYPALQGWPAYLKDAKKIAAGAKELYPAVKIGLTINRKNPDRWPIPSEDWYDAIIIHPYMPSLHELLKESKTAEFNAQFPFKFRLGLKETVASINQQYPGKEIWATEWNLMESNEESYLSGAYANAFHAYNVLLTFLEYPGQITLANFHALYGSTFGLVKPLASIQAQYLGQPPQLVPDDLNFNQVFSRRLTAWPLEWIGHAFATHSKYIVAQGTTEPTSPYGAVYFYQNDYSQQGLALINRSDQPLSLDLSSLTHLTGKKTLIRRLKSDWNKRSESENLLGPQESTLTLASNLDLAPFEIVYLTTDQISSDPVAKPGDLNGDTRVDLFDYNLLVAEYGSKYSTTDYNLLLANYGK